MNMTERVQVLEPTILRGWVKENAKLDIVTDSDVGYASLDAKLFAQQLGFSTVDQYMISIAVSELTRNILNHAGRGFLYLICPRRRK